MCIPLMPTGWLHYVFFWGHVCFTRVFSAAQYTLLDTNRHNNTLISDLTDERSPLSVCNMCAIRLHPQRITYWVFFTEMWKVTVHFKHWFRCSKEMRALFNGRDPFPHHIWLSFVSIHLSSIWCSLMYLHKHLCLSQRGFLNWKFRVGEEILEHLYETSTEAAGKHSAGSRGSLI